MWTTTKKFAKWVKGIFNPRKLMKEVITSIDFEVSEDLFMLTALHGDKKFKLVMEKDAGIGASYDALATMAKYVAELIQKNQEGMVLQGTAPSHEEQK